MTTSVVGSALNQIPLVNSTQILTASAQAPMTSVMASTPVVASTPIVAGAVQPLPATTPVLTSAVQPLAATTPVLTSAVQPLAATTPVLASPVQPLAATTPVLTSPVQPLAATTPVLTSSVPVVQPQPILTSVQPTPQVYSTASGAHFATTYNNPVPIDDYRLGRGILDDFRPTPYKNIIVGSTTGVSVANSGVVVTSPGIAVSTPGSVGASNIKDFL